MIGLPRKDWREHGILEERRIAGWSGVAVTAVRHFAETTRALHHRRLAFDQNFLAALVLRWDASVALPNWSRRSYRGITDVTEQPTQSDCARSLSRSSENLKRWSRR